MREGHLIGVAALVAFCIGVFLPQSGWPANRAWLIDWDGGAAKMDLVQSAIVQTAALPVDRILLDEVAVDPVRGNLFVPHGRGPYRVDVFDLKPLKPKGRLDFAVDRAPTVAAEAIRFIFPPGGGVFFARWWNPTANGGNGAFEVVTIDGQTFKATTRRTTSPPLEQMLMVDASGQKLYSMTSVKPAHIDVYEIPSFQQISRVDLEAFVDAAAFGRSIHDMGGGKILLNENIKTLRTDPNRFSLYVFDFASGRITRKIHTGLEGAGQLLPNTNRAVFNEAVTQKPGARMLLPGDRINPGRIHVYDTIAGIRLATITVPGVQRGQIVGVNPAEDTLYYLSSAGSGSNPKLSIINLTTYSIVKELTPPINDFKMIFFYE